MKNNSTKTISFLFTAFFLISSMISARCPDPSATICDDIESYSIDLISAQSPHWTPWSLTPGAGDDAVVSNAVALDNQSLLVSEANGDDMLLLLGDQNTGRFWVNWRLYVPDGNTGYFNTQKFEGNPGGEFGMQVEFFADGTATLDAGGADVVTHNWNSDTWMNISLDVDLTNDWMVYSIDGVEIYSWPASWETFTESGTKQLGAVNFFGNTNTLQYIDNVWFKAIPECSDDVVICDSYETYPAGSTTGGQNPWWTTWSGTLGGAEDGIVSAAQAYDGANSMYIGPGQAQDVLLLLGNQTSGNWRIEWQMYVPAGSIGYHNIQDDETPGQQWNMEAYFNSDAPHSMVTPGMGALVSGETFTHPEDAWFPVVSEIDLDNNTHTFMVDGNVVLDAANYPSGDKIGAIDFFSASANTNNYYIDAVRFISLPSPVDVTFNVNMANETVAGDGVYIAGEMNGWNGESMNDDGDGTYSRTYQFMPGDTVEYKFQNGAGGWENNLPAECGIGPNGNRYVVVGDMDVDLDLVCFNSCADCVVGINDPAFASAITIAPNPADDYTTVIFEFEEIKNLNFNLYNNLGQRISMDQIDNVQNGSFNIDLHRLTPGIYFLNITDGSSSMIEKIFVE